jgi:putative RNA 2'-phosphotransferase
MAKDLVKLGRFISLVLRHSPETIGLKLDENGWTEVESLLRGMNKKGRKIDFDTLNEIVETNNKKRYEFSEDFKKIRACQGHSIDVDLELKPVQPPEFLYHGTALKNLDIIKAEGIKKINRQYVHLSEERETAYNVGKRHGKPFIIKVLSGEMYRNGEKFYISKNNVWLSGDIDSKYLVFE